MQEQSETCSGVTAHEHFPGGAQSRTKTLLSAGEGMIPTKTLTWPIPSQGSVNHVPIGLLAQLSVSGEG